MTVSGWIWTEIESEEGPESLLIVDAEKPCGKRLERPADELEEAEITPGQSPHRALKT
jgi:hypothetical protein